MNRYGTENWQEIDTYRGTKEFEKRREEFIKRQQEAERRKQEQAYLYRPSVTDPWM